MPGMPGMNAPAAGSPWHALLILGLLVLFWVGTMLHVVRLLAGSFVAERDVPADLAHAVMGAAMAYMLFPGAWTAPNGLAAAGFAVIAAAFAVRALRRRKPWDPVGRRTHAAVISVSMAAMAAMSAMTGTPSPSSTLVGGFAATLLVGCAVAHTRILSHRKRHAPTPHLDRGQTRLLVTAPGLAVTATTLGMAYLVTAM